MIWSITAVPFLGLMTDGGGGFDVVVGVGMNGLDENGYEDEAARIVNIDVIRTSW